MRGWVKAIIQQQPPQIENALAIQGQGFDSRSPSRRDPNKRQTIRTPSKMIVPIVFTGVKERNELLTDRINGLSFNVFEIVTTLAGQRQIVCGGFAAQNFRHDMFVGMSLCGVCFRADTILAIP